MSYSGYELNKSDRAMLAGYFPFLYEKHIGHHVTYKFPSDHKPSSAKTAEVVGYQIHDGIQCLVVSINGTTIRPDGKIFHITWSLEKDKKPVQSNNILAKMGFISCNPIPINLLPKVFD